jgi:hypothetical protein
MKRTAVYCTSQSGFANDAPETEEGSYNIHRDANGESYSPMVFRVPFFLFTSSASSSTRFMYSSNP